MFKGYIDNRKVVDDDLDSRPEKGQKNLPVDYRDYKEQKKPADDDLSESTKLERENPVRKKYHPVKRTIELLTKPHQKSDMEEALACSGIINDDSSTYTSSTD